MGFPRGEEKNELQCHTHSAKARESKGLRQQPSTRLLLLGFPNSSKAVREPSSPELFSATGWVKRWRKTEEITGERWRKALRIALGTPSGSMRDERMIDTMADLKERPKALDTDAAPQTKTEAADARPRERAEPSEEKVEAYPVVKTKMRSN
jgi:hypothetical protein